MMSQSQHSNSSLILGDLRKEEISLELKSDSEDDEFILRIVEKIMNNLKLTISNVSIVFQFEEECSVLIRLPMIKFMDKTPISEFHDAWKPVFWKYQLILSKFYVQLIHGDVSQSFDDKNSIAYSLDDDLSLSFQYNSEKTEIEIKAGSLCIDVDSHAIKMISKIFKNIGHKGNLSDSDIQSILNISRSGSFKAVEQDLDEFEEIQVYSVNNSVNSSRVEKKSSSIVVKIKCTSLNANLFLDSKGKDLKMHDHMSLKGEGSFSLVISPIGDHVLDVGVDSIDLSCCLSEKVTRIVQTPKKNCFAAKIDMRDGVPRVVAKVLPINITLDSFLDLGSKTKDYVSLLGSDKKDTVSSNDDVASGMDMIISLKLEHLQVTMGGFLVELDGLCIENALGWSIEIDTCQVLLKSMVVLAAEAIKLKQRDNLMASIFPIPEDTFSIDQYTFERMVTNSSKSLTVSIQSMRIACTKILVDELLALVLLILSKLPGSTEKSVKSNVKLDGMNGILHAIKLEVLDLNFEIKSEGHPFGGNLGHMQIFLFQTSQTMQFHLRNQSSLMITNEKTCYLESMKALIKDFRKSKSPIMIDVTLHDFFDVKSYIIAIRVTGLLLHHDVTWLLTLFDLIPSISAQGVSDEKKQSSTSESTITNFKLEVIDCAVDFFDDSERILAYINQLNVETHLVFPQPDIYKIHVELEGLNFFLKNSPRFEFQQKGIEFEHQMESIGFIKISSIDTLEVSLSMVPESVKLKKGEIRLLVDVTKVVFRLNACSDSLYSLYSTLMSLYQYLESLLLLQNRNEPKAKLLSKATLESNEIPKKQTGGIMSLIQDHYFVDLDELEDKKIPIEYHHSDFTFMLSKCDLFIVIHKGSDWTASRKDLSIQFQILNLVTQLDLLEGDIRFTVSVEDAEIKNNLSNQRNLILSLLKSEKYPLPENPKIFALVILYQKFDFEVDVDILPLRVNIHQETLEFLVEFVSSVQPPKKKSFDIEPRIHSDYIPSTQKKVQDIQLHRIRIGKLHLKLHYESEFNMKKILEGQYRDLLRFIPLNGIEVKIAEQILKNVSQEDLIPRLVDSIRKNSSILGLLIGFLPLKSLTLLGSGIFDLFFLPINSLQEGHVLKGFRNGVFSFFRKISLGTVEITTSTLDTASGTFEIMSNVLGSDLPTEDRYLPTNPQEGVYEAMDSVKSSVDHIYSKFNEIRSRNESIPLKSLRLLPVLILTPLHGTTEGLSKIMHGIRAWGSRDIQQENISLFKK